MCCVPALLTPASCRQYGVGPLPGSLEFMLWNRSKLGVQVSEVGVQFPELGLPVKLVSQRGSGQP